MRIAVVIALAERDALEYSEHPGAPRGGTQARFVNDQRLLDDAADPLSRIQRRGRLLEDDGHLRAQRPQFLLGVAREVPAVEFDRSGVRVLQPQREPGKRRLA